jgi:hypothetical protein
VTSKFSVIPDGGVMELRELFPYQQRRSEPSELVVSEGAAIRRVLAL